MYVGFALNLFDEEQLDIIHLLALAPWHHSHEDIVIVMERLRDPRSIETLYLTALSEHEYLDFDDNYALGVRCTWALGKIGTNSANEKLRLLAETENPIIKKAAIFQLERLRSGGD